MKRKFIHLMYYINLDVSHKVLSIIWRILLMAIYTYLLGRFWYMELNGIQRNWNANSFDQILMSRLVHRMKGKESFKFR